MSLVFNFLSDAVKWVERYASPGDSRYFPNSQENVERIFLSLEVALAVFLAAQREYRVIVMPRRRLHNLNYPEKNSSAFSKIS